MKMTIIRVPEMTLEDFADKHNLHMVVTERKEPDGVKDRYYARFKHVEISEGCILQGAYGDGFCPEAAISAYGRAISLKTIMYDAMGKNRQEISVPRIVRGTE